MRERHVVGVDIGATNVRTAVGDNRGNILRRSSEKTDRKHGSAGISRQIVRMVQRLLKETGTEIHGIGIGSIGPLDLEAGAIRDSPNIPFSFVPLRGPLRAEFGGPIVLLNDCNAAVVGEKMFGAGRDVANLAYITLSTGIGGGVYVGGHLLLGKDGNASEIGHLVVDIDGQLECGCGKRGHWEAYCSAENIPNYVRVLLEERSVEDSSLMKSDGAGSRRITAKLLYEEARDGDSLSLEIVDSIGRINAAGFANVVNAYDPSIITVGGALALRHEDLILTPIRRHVHGYAINRVPEIVITPLGEDVVLLGAIAAVYARSDLKLKTLGVCL